MTPATAAAAATVAVLAIGRGLSSRRWAAVAGALMAAMALSRPMALVLIPALAYLAWAWTPDRGDRAARRPLLANAAVAAGSFGLLAGWWFVTAEEDLTQYLQEGAPGVDRGNLIAVFLDRIHEVFLYLGPINGMLFPGLLPAVAGFAYLGLRRFGQDPDPTASDGRLPLGPLWVAVGIAVVTTLVSNTMGWLMLPVVPWIIAATVAGARRGLSERSWRWWASIVVAIPLAGALATSLVDPVPGNRFTWCLHPFDQPSTCSIGHEDAEAHKAALVALADGNRAIFDGVSTMIEAPDTAMVSRDHALSPLAITGQSYLTDDWRQPGPLAFPLGAPEADQREVIIDQAEIVLVVPDPDAGSLLTDAMLDPDGLPDALRAAGFASCRSVVLPDDRVAEILVRASLRGTWCEGA